MLSWFERSVIARSSLRKNRKKKSVKKKRSRVPLIEPDRLFRRSSGLCDVFGESGLVWKTKRDLYLQKFFLNLIYSLLFKGDRRTRGVANQRRSPAIWPLHHISSGLGSSSISSGRQDSAFQLAFSLIHII